MDRICMHRFCPFEYKRSKYLVYLIDRNRLVTYGLPKGKDTRLIIIQ